MKLLPWWKNDYHGDDMVTGSNHLKIYKMRQISSPPAIYHVPSLVFSPAYFIRQPYGTGPKNVPAARLYISHQICKYASRFFTGAFQSRVKSYNLCCHKIQFWWTQIKVFPCPGGKRKDIKDTCQWNAMKTPWLTSNKTYFVSTELNFTISHVLTVHSDL